MAKQHGVHGGKYLLKTPANAISETLIFKMSLDASALKNLWLWWCKFQSRLLFIISLLLRTFLTVLHVTMVAKFLHLKNLSWQRRPFTLSNDIWATDLLLSIVMHRSVFSFFFSTIFVQDYDLLRSRSSSTIATWRNNYSSLFNDFHSTDTKTNFFSKARWQDTHSCIWYGLGRGKEVSQKPPGEE